MSIESRAPKRSQGVPKETPARNTIRDLQRALVGAFPDRPWGELRAELERRGFFEAGMQQQVGIMAQTAVDMAGDAEGGSAILAALSVSPVDKVRGVAAFVVPLLYGNDPEGQLQALHRTGALEGTWPHELSATVLHNLIIEHGVAAVLPRVRGWVEGPDPAVRRMAVEAFRPRGVMLAHIAELKADPTPLRALLEPLLDDGADYVRKAVANNLNDVSRDNPDQLLAWAEDWMTPEASPARRWILDRALRTLVGEGHPAALRILGYASPACLAVTWLDTLPRQVMINQLLPLEFELRNLSDGPTLVLLLVWTDEPGKGSARRRKKYQVWKGRLAPGSARQVTAKIHFVDRSRQRKEPGTYRLIATLNGETVGERTITYER
jgi:3-methyladenine DNA glycosylase AlkC